MHTFLKTSAMLLALGFTSTVFAQNAQVTSPKAKSTEGAETVIIRKKNNKAEKLNIVVDGDKITVNGKPVEDYSDDNVSINAIKGTGNYSYSFSGPADVIAKNGDWNIYSNNFARTIKSNKAVLGVMTEKTDEGAKITNVTDESAADKAGLKEGDIITKLGDDKIEDSDDLYKAVGKYKADDKVTVAYKRDGKDATVPVTLQKNKDVKVFGYNGADNFKLNMSPGIGGYSFKWGRPRFGVQAQDTEDGKGVKLLDVTDELPADKAGLKEDDLITQVNGKNITSVDDLKEAIKDGKDGDTFKVTYIRNGETKTVDVKYPKELKTSNL